MEETLKWLIPTVISAIALIITIVNIVVFQRRKDRRDAQAETIDALESRVQLLESRIRELEKVEEENEVLRNVLAMKDPKSVEMINRVGEIYQKIVLNNDKSNSKS